MLDALLGIPEFFVNIVKTGPGTAVAIILLPLALSVLKPEEAYKFLKVFVIAAAVSMSAFFNNRFGQPIGNIIERFFIKVIIVIPMSLALDFIEHFRKDNKDTLEIEIKATRISLAKMVKKK